jgi:signal transduction histidine kinase/DNA-binding response OmpR family regulator
MIGKNSAIDEHVPASLETKPRRFTIGVFGNRQVYEGTTIVRYEQTLFRGIRAAARAFDCNVLLACGIGPNKMPFEGIAAWPMLLTDTNFVPVGPWNTDGLIAIPPFTTERQHAIEQLAAYGKPIVFTSPQSDFPSQSPTNIEGILQAFDHLRQHGHERIAFIASEVDDSGVLDTDGTERFAAYRMALAAHGLPFDPDLVGYGGHDTYQSALAMQRILARGVEFTAVMTNTDESAIGVMQALKAAGLRIPQDVAVIGFDDVMYAKAQSPPLTTVRHPTFEMGYQAVELLLEYIRGERTEVITQRTPTRLIIRESCGCQPYSLPAPQESLVIPQRRWQRRNTARVGRRRAHANRHVPSTPILENIDQVVQAMADAVAVESRYIEQRQIQEWCHDLVLAFEQCLLLGTTQTLAQELDELLNKIEQINEDPYIWQTAISVLQNSAYLLISDSSLRALADQLVDQSRVRISERLRRQHTQFLVKQAEHTDRLGMLTMRLLTAITTRQILDILDEQLPALGIKHAAICMFEPEGDDPIAWSNLLVRNPDGAPTYQRFLSRNFPPPQLYDDSAAQSIALLPLVIENGPTGFVAIDASYLEPCGLIVRHLAAAFRNNQLYNAAEEGRRLAEEANRLKSRFLSTVSHELRTPLNLIIGLSEMLLRNQSSQQDSSTVTQDLEHIFANAQYLGRLIGDVLDLASSEAGQLRLYYEPLDLADILHVVAATGEQMAHERGLSWNAFLPPGLAWVRGDRTRLRQVVLNLVSNAIKFTDKGEVTLWLEVDQDSVLVSVKDTGPGVPLRDQKQIFDEFQISDRTADGGFGGLGLGLTICKQLIERHGGEIGVHSSGVEGEGSTFYFRLPLLASTEIPLNEDTRTQPQVVFLAEQQFADHHLDEALKERGFAVQVQYIDTNADWLPRLIANPPDAVILEESLASRSGWEIVNVLKRHPSTAQLAVLMYALDAQQQRGTLLELNYMIKPLDPEHLAFVIERHSAVDGQSNGKTILLVDDDAETLAMHARMIRQQYADCRILQARNGREALEVMEQTTPDLVLLDLMMPELDGFGVIEAMRSRESTLHIPVIVLSARTLNEEDINRLNAGVAAVLSKGLFNADEILHHVSTTLTHQRKLSQSTQQFVRRAVAYIHTHYAEPITRDQVAAYVGISADYLTACFHQEMGIRPIAYLNRYRINRARTLLEEGNGPIIEIAHAVGFSDLANFSRTFHREVGMTPNAYRKSRQR